MAAIISITFTGCDKGEAISGPSTLDGTSGSETGSGQGTQNQAGVITAGEWNDLANWPFWEDLLTKQNFAEFRDKWGIHNNNRISVQVTDADSKPVIDASVVLKKGSSALFRSRTDNKGRAELWADLFQRNTHVDFSELSIEVNDGAALLKEVKPYKEGMNSITLSAGTSQNMIDVAMVVDATGSMGDELEYLKTELLDVVNRAKADNSNSTVRMGSVFYRDEGDNYLTKLSGFSENPNATINFIKDQSADGGGDFPEAVHAALDKAVNELQWSANARTRLLFLVLDAPPHSTGGVMNSLHVSIAKAAGKGIKIIPITASGIDKETEFLMRFMAISTNGTYVFITNHSGIGNDHLQPTVGDYQVEYLNNLMVRLIDKYAE